MGQTRINLKHLLEDIRDSYPFPEEETIVAELVANALDSGASSVRFDPQPGKEALTVLDDGRGMTRRNLKTYHDIAASTKVRGKGIGFAGIGAKLSLLFCSSVVTETRQNKSHHAARWHLESPMKAPWRYIPPAGWVPEGASGTAVTFHLSSPNSKLLDPAFLEDVLRRHFEPLLDARFTEAIYNRLYHKPFTFLVGERKLEASASVTTDPARKFFPIHMGARRNLAGYGWVGVHQTGWRLGEGGLGVATYGKVIKRGWEWLGIRPRNPERITGMVEIPGLASLLTTNKADFLKDSSSLKQYYRFRKAVLKTLEPALQELGEWQTPPDAAPRKAHASQREIEQVVAGLVAEFPELTPLLDARRRTIPGAGEGEGDGGEPGSAGMVKEEALGPSDATKETEAPVEKVAEGEPKPDETGEPKEAGEKRKPAGLKIVFDLRPDRAEMGWLSGTTVCVNQAHPAYRRAVEMRSENYHVAVTVAWVLSQYVEDGKPIPDFINRFLAGWGKEG